MKTQAQIRTAFWQVFPEFKKGYIKTPKGYYRPKTQNEYECDIRVTFIDFVENLYRNGEISQQLANKVTL
jgi:hypothetical protein